MAAGVILAHIEFYGLVAIAPAFYELFAALYYGVSGRNPARKKACQNPIILPDGSLCPPPGAEHYTLAYFLLSKRLAKEPRLVGRILALYLAAGLVAVALSVV